MDALAIAEFSAQVQRQNEQNAELMRVINDHLVARPGPGPTNLGHLIPRYLDKPPTFDGKNRGSCEAFLSQCRQFISACPAAVFQTEMAKIDFVVSYLKDTAFTWAQPHLEKRNTVEAHEMFASFATFCQTLLENLGESDLRGSNNRRLRALRQTGSAAHYVTEFFAISAQLDWGDEGFRVQFRQGLKSEVKDHLAWRDTEPATLKELAEAAIRADNRIFERRLEDRIGGRSQPARTLASRISPRSPMSYTSATSNADALEAPGPVPMEIDATTRRSRPLTAQERTHRLSHNLCLYCGEAGHRVAQCSQRGSPRGSSIQATTSLALATIPAESNATPLN